MSATEDKMVSKLAVPSALPAAAPGVVRLPSPFVRLATWAAVLVLLVLALEGVGAVLLRRATVRHRLDARLAAAFGRPVEVDSYSFTLWGGPTLEAAGVRVEEDPRFGYEYFLRAEALAVRLRWLSLLRGRLTLGTLSLTGPTLNVAENPAGEWNLAQWLGHPMAATPGSVTRPAAASFVPTLQNIQVDGGRINFKRGNEKLPFAFVDVAGTIESDGGARWRVNLAASPWRAASILQQAGTIHLAGSVGGTSSALRPADLQMNWADASVSDFLRLIGGDDRGVRGSLRMALNARTSGEGWSAEGRAQLAGLHRWDLAERPDNPSVNVSAKMALDLAGSSLQITQAILEAPHSNAQAEGRIAWAGAAKPAAKARGIPPRHAPEPPSSPAAIEVTGASIDMSDLLSWLRAFHSGIPDSAAVQGTVVGHARISGWPLRATDAAATSAGAALFGGGLQELIHVGALQLNYAEGALRLAPATVRVDAPPRPAPGRLPAPEVTQPSGLFRVEVTSASAVRGRTSTTTGLHVAGGSSDASALIAAADAFGWNISRGWNLSGPLHCDLRWPPDSASGQWPWQARPVGTLTIGGAGADAAKLSAPFLNFPVDGLQARVDWKPGTRHVTLMSAQAFGARWTGALDRADSADQWTFALAAARLSSADLDRWLNPRWRESLIDRVLPFLNSPQDAGSVAETLRGAGHLSVDEFAMPPFSIDRLEGQVTIDGRHVVFDGLSGQLNGGTISGAALDVHLNAAPVYAAHATFTGVNLGPPSSSAAFSPPAFSGIASGQITFWMQGATRQDLFGSLQCNGSLDISDAAWRGVELGESLASAALVSGNSVFREAQGQFSCDNRAVDLKNIILAGADGRIEGSGSVDFTRNLNLALRVAPPGGTTRGGVLVTGTPDAPEFKFALAPQRGR